MARFVLISAALLLLCAVFSFSAPKCGLDVVFVMDRSQSVTKANFEIVKGFVGKFAEDLVNRFRSRVGQDGMQFALVPFNTYANIHLYLNQSSSLDDVQNAVSSLQYFPGLTNTYDAFDKVYHQVLVEATGDREKIPDVLILITDGAYTEGTDNPSILADKLRAEKKAQVVAIGVQGLNGDDHRVFYEELLGITRDRELIFNVTKYDGIFGVMDKLMATVNCTQL